MIERIAVRTTKLRSKGLIVIVTILMKPLGFWNPDTMFNEMRLSLSSCVVKGKKETNHVVYRGIQVGTTYPGLSATYVTHWMRSSVRQGTIR
jgi:hypothetical protein